MTHFPHEMTPDALQGVLISAKPVVVIDVREHHEWITGHIPQAKHIPLGELPDRLAELPRAQMVIVCRSGVRSNKACLYLDELGYDVVNLVGGMLQWEGEIVYTEMGE